MSARNMAKRTAAGTLALAVCLGGGAIALAGAASADANFKFDQRIAGEDRFLTAIEASKAAFKDGSAENVVLVNGYATVDGLTASYLAGVANAPILYVDESGADKATQAEIKRLGAKNVWLVGGEAKIPASVEKAIAADYKVYRVAGEDRYETAAKIAAKGIELSGKKPSKVFVASGTSFADALAVSPVAYAKGYPIILTEKDSTSDFSKKELGAIGTDNKILVGGEAVVSKKVQGDLSIKDDQRVAGADRAVTANLVSDWAKKSEGFNPANAALVGGTNGNGADSLVASALGAKSGTTLHFAGWDATYTYLKDHSAELTGKGFVFGGKAAVPGDQVDKAQAAAQTAKVAVGYTVLTYAGSGAVAFTYADPAAKASATATFSSSDKFTVDGATASIGAFQAALTAGDQVTISQNTPSAGVTTYALVNKTVTSGMVGNTTANTAFIIDAVTGLPITAAITLNPANALYKVDGASVSYTAFQAEVNEGDSLEITGGDGSTAALTRTFSLTNATVSGTVNTVTNSPTTPAFSVKTAAGASLGDIALGAGDTEFQLASTDILSVDGSTVSVGDFDTALTAGDSVSVSRKGGKYTVDLKNSAPSPISGVAASASGGNTVNYFTGTNTSTTPQNISAVTTYKLDGSTVTLNELLAAVTPGDTFVYQADNTATTSVNESSVSLTNQSLVGKVADVKATSIDVLYAGTTGVLSNDLAYGTDYVFANNTAITYFVNGASKSLAQFKSELSLVGNGSKLGTVEVVDNGVTTEYKLSSSTNSAAATLVSFAKPANGANPATLTLTFDKPVYLSDTFAASDITVTQNGTNRAISGISPATASAASNTVTITFGTAPTWATGEAIVVSISSTGAAKLLDANGTAASAGSKSDTI